MERAQRVSFGVIKPFLTSHHPHCRYFENDVYLLKGRRLCIGCFTSYPIAIAVVVLWFFGFFPYYWHILLLLGLIFGLVQLLSFTRLTDRKGVKVLVKVFLGLGFGFFASGIMAMPVPLWVKVVTFINLGILTGMLGFFRYKKVIKICERCEYKGNYFICPGFAPLYGASAYQKKEKKE
ncbi:MAG: hypothetical protein JSW28_01390 [Thermoplasmata archaeon]|nr:MAG: hypothetical protein JSW28_01390 [Thermoplasmata archaeon]